MARRLPEPVSTTNYFRQARNAAAVAAVALAAMSLTACDPGPQCADWSVQTVTGSHVVNGRVVPYVHTAQVCTRYEDDK